MLMMLFFLLMANVGALPTPIGSCLFQFWDPAFPAFALPAAQLNSPDGTVLNADNPIQFFSGPLPIWTCSSGKFSYQTSTGAFSSMYTDSNGRSSSIATQFYLTSTCELKMRNFEPNNANLESFLCGKILQLVVTSNFIFKSCVHFTITCTPPIATTTAATTTSSTTAGNGCFSKDENVTMADFRSVRIGDVRTGDLVWTMSRDSREMQLSEVMMVSHVAPNDKARFYTVETITGHRLSLTGNHYIQVHDHGYLQANQLSTNHSLYVVMNDRTMGVARIRSIKSEVKTGVYNLFTVDGSYLVNGIAASSYINITHFSHEETHDIVAPLRWAYVLSKLFRGFEGLYPVEQTVRQGLIQVLKKHFDALVFFNYARNIISAICITLLAISSFAFVSGMVNEKSFSYKMLLGKKAQ